MISPTSLLSAPSAIGGAHPAGDHNAVVRDHAPASPTGWGATRPRYPLGAPAPVDSALTRFLVQPCMELSINHALEPAITISRLQHPPTFDAVLQRARKILREAGTHGGTDGAIYQTALQVLDRNVVLRNQSRTIRGALHQG
ncbi:hypothetical protein BOSP111201_24470 [Bordetella sputigena]|uniref:type III secretion apparatus assembly protein SctX n=1 Tax=Bordetella sputigena TaxID=1416810 RepID=UPI0039EEAF90